MLNNQLQLKVNPSISVKSELQPLDINSLNLYWSHKGFFNLDLYEKILKEKESDKAPKPEKNGDNIKVSFSYGFNYLLEAARKSFKDYLLAFNRKKLLSYNRAIEVEI